MRWFPTGTPRICQTSFSFHEGHENVCVMDRHFGTVCNFIRCPCRNMVPSNNFSTFKMCLKNLSYYNLGYDFLPVVQGWKPLIWTSLINVTDGQNAYPLNWSHSNVDISPLDGWLKKGDHYGSGDSSTPTLLNAQMHTHTYTETHRVCVSRTHTHTHTLYIRTHTHAHAHTHTHTHTHAHAHEHTHTHRYTDRHTHTHTRAYTQYTHTNSQ